MELVRVAITRRNADGSSELNIHVETTPAGSLLAGALALWIGARLFRLMRRRWWLPVGAGVAILAVRQLAPAHKDQEEMSEEE